MNQKICQSCSIFDDPITICKYIGEMLPKAQFQHLHAQILFGIISSFGPRGRLRLLNAIREGGKDFDLCKFTNSAIPSLIEVQQMLFSRM